MIDIDRIPERRLQHAVRRLFSDPSRVYHTEDGQRMQVLAPGRINVHEGPDFLDVVLLIGSDVRVGCAEFHRRSSDWIAHNHEHDLLYEKVVLHIVFDDNVPVLMERPTLVLKAEEVAQHLAFVKEQSDGESMEDIHTYSLLRLLRTTAEHRALLQHRTAVQTFLRSSQLFLQRYIHKRRRPGATVIDLHSILQTLEYSAHARFIGALEQRSLQGSVPEILERLQLLPIAQEGAHLRLELIINCLLPCALAIAPDEARVNIFEWYWSAHASNEYAVLRRMFRTCPQTFLWQQQGMLEILREKHIEIAAHEQKDSYGLYHQVATFISMALDKPR